ncbi:MAG: hypothetical protein A2X78_02000 [Gammaproteobacteria bacterium GWE2_37_16]|nr:MAG: hypothetical protein A2X78_02000 [Gammaproteobacteria bacterium GWE2_37_16]
MKLNLLSLSPDSFVLGPPHLLEQFYPKKILNIFNNTEKKSFETRGGYDKIANSISTPWAVEIHLTSNCQCNCLHCSYTQRNQDSAELSSLTVNKILGSINNLNISSLIYSGGGDPLAWQGGEFEEILKRDVPYNQSIATNGLGIINNFTPKTLQLLDILQINVSGYNQYSYSQTTQTNNFNLFIQNMHWLFNNRNKNTTQITGKIVINNRNYLMVRDYLQFCMQMDFDVVIIKLAGNFEPDQNVALNLNQKQKLRELIYNSPAINYYPAQIDAIVTNDNSVELQLSDKCWAIEYGLYMLIRSNGDVFPCVASTCDTMNSIGNVYDRHIEEIWESVKHKAVKKKLHLDMKSCKCNLNVCRHMRYNLLLDKVVSSSQYIETLPYPAKSKPKLL